MGRSALVAELRSAAPPHREFVDPPTLARLAQITADLVAACPEALSSAEQFDRQGERRLELDRHALLAGIQGRVVLVTGGTGCIGSALLSELRDLGPKRVVSLSRGLVGGGVPLAGVEYEQHDIREGSALHRVFDNVRPDVVFHLAAQRDPGLAERAVRESLETNVAGTANLLAAAVAAGVDSIVYASTGKALRPFSPHIYAASKKIGEFLACATACSRGTRISVVRFTHVVDNSLVLRRFRAIGAGNALRVHDPKTQFYTQSAREAAQLLLRANAENRPPGVVEVMAIRDLGLPTGLLDLALAVVAESGEPRGIYIAGTEPGYEDTVYPGLYDPETAADVSPLLNAFEASVARGVEGAGIDASPMRFPDYERLTETVAQFISALPGQLAPEALRKLLNGVSMTLLSASLDCVEPSVLQRVTRLTSPWRDAMSETDRAIDDCLRERAVQPVA